MKLSILFIGSEILNGKTLNSNGHFINRLLSFEGYIPDIEIVIPDNRDSIIKTIRNLLQETDCIIIGGGLGPTSDDITREAVSAALREPLEFHQNLYDNILERYKNYSFRLPDINRSQAMLPAHSIPIPNPVGMAYGIYWEKGEKSLFVLPGVPQEYKAMAQSFIISRLNKKYHKKNQEVFLLRTSGIPESSLMLELEPFMKEFCIPVQEIGFYPSYSGVDLYYRSEKPNFEFHQCVSRHFSSYIYSKEKKDLPEILLNICKEKKLSLAFAESCTGGLMSKLITDIPGSSQVFMGGFIVYSNEMKKKYLNVSEKTLNLYGAVSSETANEMLIGLLKTTGADMGIAVTGIAGPAGGTEEKPVGTVYAAYGSQKDNKIISLKGGRVRETIRERTAYACLYHLWKMIHV